MIRRYLALCLIAILAVKAESIHWMGAYDRAMQMARSAHKKLLVLLVRPHRDHAASLVLRLANDPTLSHKIATDFVAVIVTVDAHASYPIEMYYTTEFPALFLINAAEELPLGDPCVGSDAFGCLRSRFVSGLQKGN